MALERDAFLPRRYMARALNKRGHSRDALPRKATRMRRVFIYEIKFATSPTYARASHSDTQTTLLGSK